MALATLSDKVTTYYPWDYAKAIGEVKKSPVMDRYATSAVVKQGRTTRVTQGEVSAYELDGVGVDYSDTRRPRVFAFDNVIEVIGTPATKPFSLPGDSGSFIFDANSLEPYALLFGGGPDDKGIDRTLAHFMPDVLDHLGVRIVQ